MAHMSRTPLRRGVNLMKPEEREVAIRVKAAELQPNAEPEMQLILYVAALLDLLNLSVDHDDEMIAMAPNLTPYRWRRGVS